MKSRSAKIECVGLESKEITLDMIEIPKSKRATKAAIILIVLWMLAGFSVIFPGIHFILVPGFFIAGIFFSTSAYLDDVRIADNKWPCHSCSAEVLLSERGDQLPVWIKCPSCQIEYKIFSQRT